jgi:hypothetical protein
MKDALGHGSNGRGGGSLTDAAREKVGIGKMIDETHYPSRTPTDLEAMQSLASGPKAAPVALHPMFTGLGPIEPPEVTISKMQREHVASAAKRVTAIQTGEAFR